VLLPVLLDLNRTVPAAGGRGRVGASGRGRNRNDGDHLMARASATPRARSAIPANNGVDLRQLRLKSFRSLLGIVQQDV